MWKSPYDWFFVIFQLGWLVAKVMHCNLIHLFCFSTFSFQLPFMWIHILSIILIILTGNSRTPWTRRCPRSEWTPWSTRRTRPRWFTRSAGWSILTLWLYSNLLYLYLYLSLFFLTFRFFFSLNFSHVCCLYASVYVLYFSPFIAIVIVLNSCHLHPTNDKFSNFIKSRMSKSTLLPLQRYSLQRYLFKSRYLPFIVFSTTFSNHVIYSFQKCCKNRKFH